MSQGRGRSSVRAAEPDDEVAAGETVGVAVEELAVQIGQAARVGSSDGEQDTRAGRHRRAKDQGRGTERGVVDGRRGAVARASSGDLDRVVGQVGGPGGVHTLAEGQNDSGDIAVGSDRLLVLNRGRRLRQNDEHRGGSVVQECVARANLLYLLIIERSAFDEDAVVVAPARGGSDHVAHNGVAARVGTEDLVVGCKYRRSRCPGSAGLPLAGWCR